MAIANRATATEIGKAYAEAIRGEAAAKQLWARSHRDYVELWLVTEPIEVGVDRPLYAAEDVLYDRFPEAYIHLHILNPRLFDDFDAAELVPAGAEEIPLRVE